MRKLTTKILADMMMSETSKFTKQMNKLHEKFHNKTLCLTQCYELVTLFPNLQTSKDFKTLWTPDVNSKVTNVIINFERNFPRGPVDAYPFIRHDGNVIYASKTNPKLDGEYEPFHIATRIGPNFVGGFEEVDGWRDEMEKEGIPQIIINLTKKNFRNMMEFYKRENGRFSSI